MEAGGGGGAHKTGGLVTAPLPRWNVRGYSYGERQADGQLHIGADLNVGGGDEDLGLSVVCFAAGTVVYREAWDGHRYGYGGYGLVAHSSELLGIPLWSLYAHLDELDPAFEVGATLTAGQRIGACGKSGWQTWAHLHFELRYDGPPRMQPGYWGGRLTPAELGERYADPYTLLRVLGAYPDTLGHIRTQPDAVDPTTVQALQRDRDYNFALKMTFEATLRELERTRRLKRGTVDRLIASV